MNRLALTAIAAAGLIAAPAAAATTFTFGGSAGTTGTSMTFTSGGRTLTAVGFTYEGQPSAFPLGNGTAAPAPIHQSAQGIGVCQAGETGDFCRQVESHGPNASEGMAFVMDDGSAFRIESVTFSIIDGNDTLLLYGADFDSPELTNLGYDGTIQGGLTGVTSTRVGAGTYRVTLNTGAFQFFAFGQQRRGDGPLGDGFRIDSLSVAAVPEPATWAMMIAGFGMVGAGLRRRSGRPVTVTA